ncbi:hypothetical protein Scep_011202 [Stephania cephalantha]|uniref:Uncharacterized protein n=1 Tax=Stephania cephalantha TaxID=152367 RepID=A0AAP0JCW8_9MAGN
MFSSLVNNNNNNNKNKGERNNNQDPFSSREVQTKSATLRGNSSNMWWDKVRAGLSQRFNFEGIVSAVAVVARDRCLAVFVDVLLFLSRKAAKSGHPPSRSNLAGREGEACKERGESWSAVVGDDGDTVGGR